MNLLDKKTSLGALVLGLFLFVSCEKNGPFGLNSEDVAPVEFFTTEIPVTTSAVWLDSVQSSNVGTLLVGDYTSNTFGSMQATAYTRVNLNRGLLPLIPSESEFDSIRLNLRFNYVFDTSATARSWGFEAYSVARGVTDTLHITSDRALVSTDLFASADLEISKLDTTFAIDFKEAWGLELFNLLKDENEQVADQESFDTFFRGLAFVSKAGSDPNIFGISISEESSVTLYYREPGLNGEINLARTHDMTFSGVPGFYNLTVDRSGTPTSFLTDTNIEYSPASEKRFIQTGAGLVTKLNISAFRDFITGAPRIINLAEVTLGPIDVLDDNTSPPAEIFFALTDERNTLISDQGTFRSIQSDGNSPISSDSPARLIYDDETRTYTGSITGYMQAYFAEVFQRDELFFYPVNMNNNVNGISFDAGNIKLNIIYSELQ